MNGSGKHHVHQTQFGVVNTSDESFFITCPVLRPSSTQGVTVAVTGSLAPGVSMTCTLNSNIAEGQLVSLKSFTVTGTAPGVTPFTRYLYLQPSDAPYLSFQSLVCSLPGNYKARLRGLVVSS